MPPGGTPPVCGRLFSQNVVFFLPGRLLVDPLVPDIWRGPSETKAEPSGARRATADRPVRCLCVCADSDTRLFVSARLMF